MIFEPLWESAQRGELMLIDGGFCHWHLRRDGVLVIREIIATRRGAGSEMLGRLRTSPEATAILAKCPADLDANGWYERRGFTQIASETTRSGRSINVWQLDLT